jgi:cephalosporin hydroxylase
MKKYNYQDIPGYTDQADFEFLYELCELAPNEGTLLEIGTLFGRSAMFFAETMRKLNKNYQIVCLDRFHLGLYSNLDNECMLGDLDLLGQFKSSQLTPVELVKSVCSQYPEITIIKQSLFLHIPEIVRHVKLALVFEDSEHSYESTSHCLETYYPKLADGGIYCGDDYSWTQVKRAANEFASKHNLSITTNNKIWYLHEPT